MLNNAKVGGVLILDTSSAYGNAEEILGDVKAGESFKIVSKYPKCDNTVAETFNNSLKVLGIDCLYGYLLHHFEAYRENKPVWNDFVQLQKEGKVDRIGFSLYEPWELDQILKDGIPFSLIQVPYNIFDRQFEPYFKQLKEMGVEIHVRSTFLQGLFFKDRETLPEKLQPLKKYLIQLDEYAASKGISVGDLALNYNLYNPYIDGVLIGVDNKEQLLQNFASVKDIEINLDIKVEELELLKPVNWQ
ncbi:aldo/keto reductase family protein [Bacteroides fragilis str. S38L5]|uniref:Aldo/keto reductase family protein n=3 Tax=Bacteroides fragilis TaxID=817 RepID=A0A015T1B3_BACFG|nr:aldo/keto reductase family protein [Bacteroides fragilis str. 3988T(B)14]EXY77446.1 aldo/keto reductase family protein [Bacteroides fragilis str. 3988 T1]EXZ07823.1 aldo/keto reductase family protein [Bacteroides fragilis str. DS-71]EYA60408.1 aldo/keto reductase family protein [Bacteroides fragilis str. A7 (UDC12-2)]EYA93659.1 aldo/keto reductase family protein [Bacteroides fragilis str. S38L5]EYB13247.1 aldo/keto reductase family protein [Bacteroides fragilis str. S38L3]